MTFTNNSRPESADRRVSPVRLEKIEIARRKIESGDYNRPEVLKRIVSRIMDQIERES